MPVPTGTRAGVVLATVGVLLAGSTAASSALAEPTYLVVDVSVEDPDVPLDPGTETDLNVTVTNEGTMNGTVELDATVAGPAWNVELADDRFPLDAGETERVPMRIEAPPPHSGPGREGAVTVHATLSEHAGELSARDEGETTVRVAGGSAPSLGSTDWLPHGGLGLGIALLAGVATWRAAAGRSRVTLDAPAELSVAPGGEEHAKIAVGNPTGDEREVDLAIEGAPSGWSVALGASSLTLAADQTTDVWLSVAPRDPNESRSVDVRVVARPRDDGVEGDAAWLQVRVAEEGATGGPGPGSAPA